MKHSNRIFFTFRLLSVMIILNSCARDGYTTITESGRYSNSDIKSYADFFKVFWTVMDDNYASFYEQQQSGLNWNAVYKEYYPKFLALKNFQPAPGVTDLDIQNDGDKALQYIKEIITPITDRNLIIKIKVPYSRNSNLNFKEEIFTGGMKDKQNNNTFNVDDRLNFIRDYQVNPVFVNENLVVGNPKQAANIYYIGFKSLTSLKSFNPGEWGQKYLTPESQNTYVITAENIKNRTELDKIKDVNSRDKTLNWCVNELSRWDTFFNSDDVKSFNNQLSIFKKTENITSLLLLADKLSNQLDKFKTPTDAVNSSGLLTGESYPFMNWFNIALTYHINYGYKLPEFKTALENIKNIAPFYSKILGPLNKGDMKKIIIDMRGIEGELNESSFFIDHFITKNATWAYQRMKEGNGKFNYTPWVPKEVTPVVSGMPASVPIAILTDRKSSGLGEALVLQLKSQGNQVASIGDYTAGTNGFQRADDSNGGSGITGIKAGNNFEFTMSSVIYKSQQGEVITGFGIKPDIYISPPSDSEIMKMKNTPGTFKDQSLAEAIKYLLSK